MGHLPKIPTTTSSIRTELLGTFLLVLIGTSALTALNVAGQATTASAMLVGTLAFSVAIGWLTYIFYRFPMPQFNPAVTVLFWVQGIQPLSRSLIIIIVQLVGAVAASVVVALLYGSAGVEVRLGATYPATLMGSWAALIAEILGSIIVLSAIQAAINRQRLAFFNPFLLIGLGYGLGYLLATGISGGALNPARAIAPQLAAADLTGWWAYIVGPIIAAVGVGYWARRSTATQPTEIEVFQTKSTPELKEQTVSQPTHNVPQSPKVQSESNESQESQSESSLSSTNLQEKAQAAIDKLKSSPERPHLPFALSKPSFYPLKGSRKQDEDEKEISGISNPEEAAAQLPEEPKLATSPATKPAVKFVDFEHKPLEEDE